MTINVYWTTIDNVYVKTPESVWVEIINKYNNQFTKCPVTIQYYKNTFSMKSPLDYMIRWTGNRFESDMYDQSFFDAMVLERDSAAGIFSYFCPSIMLVPDKPVLMETKQATHGIGELCRNTSLIEGVYDPHQHIRKLETAGIFHEPRDIHINENDDLYYIKFHTNERIKFKRFTMSNEIHEFVDAPLLINRNYTKRIKPMSWWYKVSKERGTTKKMLKHAKNNLCN